MVHSTLRCSLVAACCLAWSTAACSSKHSNPASHDAPGLVDGHTGGGSGDAPNAGAPACAAGDRTEFSGPIPNTTLDVVVCSKCGESYVVAANSSSSAAQVSVGSGSAAMTTNVPAGGTVMTTAVADNPADGTISVCGAGSACLSPAPVNQAYCNPFRDIMSLSPERIDQGVDYGGAGPLYAMGPGTIDVYNNRDDAGWPGETFVSYILSAGPGSGRDIYLAENIDLNPALKAGSFVYNGTVLGTLVNASPNLETGWGVQGASSTAEGACYVEGCSTTLGTNFNQLLVCLNAPSGLPTTVTTCCPASDANGYPTDWCSLVTAWQ